MVVVVVVKERRAFFRGGSYFTHSWCFCGVFVNGDGIARSGRDGNDAGRRGRRVWVPKTSGHAMPGRWQHRRRCVVYRVGVAVIVRRRT